MKKTTLIIAIITTALSLSACGAGGGGGEGASPSSSPDSIPQNTELAPITAADPGGSAYDITLLGAFTGNSFAVALNDSTQVTGNYTDQYGSVNAFIWADGSVRHIVTGCQASQINNLGQVVDWMEPNGHPKAYVYEGVGQVCKLNTVGGSSQALAINDS